MVLAAYFALMFYYDVSHVDFTDAVRIVALIVTAPIFFVRMLFLDAPVSEHCT